jgi:flagellin-specific chaperone FliS
MGTEMDGADHGAAQYKRAIMLSEPPGVMWIVRGWRGLRTYLLRAAQAAESGDIAGKVAALGKASALLAFLYAITPRGTPTGRSARLGAAIAPVYQRLHCLLALANARNDAASIREVSDALAHLEEVFIAAHDAARTA